MDRLSTLLSLFGVRASLFYSGELCGVSLYDGVDQRGYIHLLQEGELGVVTAKHPLQVLTQPSLIFIPRPSRHHLIGGDSGGARLQCASLEFAGGANNPLAASLPDLIVLPLAELPLLSDTLRLLFAEAADDHCGRDAALDRLFELVIIHLFRHLLDNQKLSTGIMAGLADSRLARSLVRVHKEPQRPWSISEMATESNMSRSSYAAHFKDIVGQTPAEYLLSWRISLAQKLLLEGRPMALISEDVGYESPSALARAFRRKTGFNPSDWMKTM